MKRTVTRYCLVLLLLLCLSPALRSQSLFENANGERIQAITDRSIYVSGETVYFTAVVYHESNPEPRALSRILYCELITPGGNKITGRKYLLHDFSGNGAIAIPEETITGVYYLRFYTRFMRNAGADAYKYILLKIINPLKPEVLQGQDLPDTTLPDAGTLTETAKNHSMQVVFGKNEFLPREEIRLNINRDAPLEKPVIRSLTIIPESAYRPKEDPAKMAAGIVHDRDHYPETRGISLTGQILSKETGNPIPYCKVNLSIIGDKDILVVRSDFNGQFFFALPDHQGKKDLFLCATEQPGITPEVLIDNDFCSKPVDLPAPVFSLNREEEALAYRLTVNYMVNAVFTKDSVTSDTLPVDSMTSFYGRPSEVIVIDKYIELPTLREYFTELPVIVKIRKQQGKQQFRFFLAEGEMLLYDPLVLVDWVAVEDMDKILAMSPQEIDRIELLNFPYIKGNITNGGIISFISKKNDFAGIDLPTSGTFINYGFLEPDRKPLPQGPYPANIPDSRNTVYWNPDMQVTGDGKTEFAFYAPDTPGRYVMLLQSISKTGEITREKVVFEVTAP
jgi:hypothetical protein